MTKEQRFYSLLENLFVGAKLEGDSGYVNLMNIKTDYFNKIRERIREEVGKRFSGKEPEDLFDKLYSFFDSYFSDGGAIFFSSTPVYKNIYTQVYSDREDVSLFWKTAKLYYVKSEANYKSIENLTIDTNSNIVFDFDASLLKHKQANEKKELEFYFVGVRKREGKTVIKFKVIYKNDNKYARLQEILKIFKIKEKAEIIKYLFTNIEKLSKLHITAYNEGLDYAKVSNKATKEKAEIEFIIWENTDLHKSVNIAPAVNDISEIEKYLKLKGIVIDEENLKKVFKTYMRQTEIDYFIHKDAKTFLREQFNLYTYHRIGCDIVTIFDQKTLEKEQKIKQIAYLVIDYIGNFEDELKKIWLKPKFARKSNYVVTLDRLEQKGNGIEVIKKIIKHKNIDAQINEWIELGITDKDFDKKDIIKDDKLNKNYQFLPIDTNYFKDLEIEILCLFDNLDEELDGRLIKSENFQALNTLLPKYASQVQTIYIDPPFNLGEGANFDYLVNYKDSTWATLLENRLNLAKEILNSKGSIFVRCDYNGNFILRSILNKVFDSINFRNEIAVGRTLQGALNTQFKKMTTMNTGYDNIYWYSVDPNTRFKNFVKPAEEKGSSYWHVFHKPTDRKNLRYDLFGITPKYGQWLWSRDKAMLAVKNYNDFENENLINKMNIEEYWGKTGRTKEFLKHEGESLSYSSVKYWIPPRETILTNSNWTTVSGYSSRHGFQTENSEPLLQRIIVNASNIRELVIDFFLGSGTTTAVAHKLGRKWLGVEVGEQFYKVILPRMKYVLAYDKGGISKEVKEYKGGGFFKYYELEQYEDVLRMAFYNPLEEKLENIDFSLSEKLAKHGLKLNFNKEKARFVFEELYRDVDIAETISNLYGKKIKKLSKDKVIFNDDTEIDINNLDFEKNEALKKLIYW